MPRTELEPESADAHWNVPLVRKDFPCLGRNSDGQPIAYLDGPAGSLVPSCVLDMLAKPGGAGALAGAQAAFADWVGGAPDEIVVGPSMTALALQASLALALQWKRGDNIVLTRQDHCANTGPWRAAAGERGIEVRWVGVDANGSLDLADLARKVTKRTRLLAFPAASNVLGTINDVPLIVSMVRRSDLLVFVDAVHFDAHRPADAAAWDCDFLACSAYKFYGPRTASLWIRESVRESLRERTHMATLSGTILAPGGTPPISTAMLGGVQAAIDYLAGNAPGSSRRQRLERSAAAFSAHEQRLLERLWEGLARIPGVDVHGLPPDSARTATVAFSLDGVPAQLVGEGLARLGIQVGCGHFNAMPLVEALGHASGVARAGCMMYSTKDEVDRLLGAVAEAARSLRR